MTVANSPQAWTDRSRLATSADCAMWSPAGQLERFRAVMQALDPQPGDSFLDYGCGTGALSRFVPHGVRYVGYDWSPGMVERARRDHPGVEFTASEPEEWFDHVAFVGPFNLVDNWSKEQTWNTLARRWAGCGKRLAVCLYAGMPHPAHLTYDEREAWAFVDSLGQGDEAWVIRDRPNDILLVVWR